MDNAVKYAIACKGLKNGTHEFGFDVDSRLFEVEQSDDIHGGEFSVQVTMRKAGSLAELDVRLDGYAVTECDRCLEDCRVPVEFEGTLAVRFTDGEEEYDGEVMQVPAAEGEIDLTHYIYESIVLSLPYSRVHPEGECNPEMVARISGTLAEEPAEQEIGGAE